MKKGGEAQEVGYDLLMDYATDPRTTAMQIGGQLWAPLARMLKRHESAFEREMERPLANVL